MNSDDDDFDPRTLPPTKGMRKRAAQRAQQLGARLVELRESELAALDLPEILADAIRACRSITAHGGRARQLQYIGKLMRGVDHEPILHALEAPSRAHAEEGERHKRVSAWRDRLLAEGESAVVALGQWRSGMDLGPIRAALAKATDARGTEAMRLGAKRELFRVLRELFA
jgi:ribosome-associated protein